MKRLVLIIAIIILCSCNVTKRGMSKAQSVSDSTVTTQKDSIGYTFNANTSIKQVEEFTGHGVVIRFFPHSGNEPTAPITIKKTDSSVIIDAGGRKVSDIKIQDETIKKITDSTANTTTTAAKVSVAATSDTHKEQDNKEVDKTTARVPVMLIICGCLLAGVTGIVWYYFPKKNKT